MSFRYIVEVNGEPDEQAEKDLSSYAGQQAMARSRRCVAGFACSCGIIRLLSLEVYLSVVLTVPEFPMAS
jgi:hypothetical protein